MRRRIFFSAAAQLLRLIEQALLTLYADFLVSATSFL